MADSPSVGTRSSIPFGPSSRPAETARPSCCSKARRASGRRPSGRRPSPPKGLAARSCMPGQPRPRWRSRLLGSRTCSAGYSTRLGPGCRRRNGARLKYIYDDEGRHGGLGAGEHFVIAGDQNADPFDGDSVDFAIRQLLNHPTPASHRADRNRSSRRSRTRSTTAIKATRHSTRPTSMTNRRPATCVPTKCSPTRASTSAAASCSGRRTPTRCSGSLEFSAPHYPMATASRHRTTALWR
jgi:Endonuclease/Exonuclease/phosphatase family